MYPVGRCLPTGSSCAQEVLMFEPLPMEQRSGTAALSSWQCPGPALVTQTQNGAVGPAVSWVREPSSCPYDRAERVASTMSGREHPKHATCHCALTCLYIMLCLPSYSRHTKSLVLCSHGNPISAETHRRSKYKSD